MILRTNTHHFQFNIIFVCFSFFTIAVQHMHNNFHSSNYIYCIINIFFFFFVVCALTVRKYNQQNINDNEQATNSAEIRQKRKQINQHRLQHIKKQSQNQTTTLFSCIWYQRHIAAQRDRRYLHSERFRWFVEVVLGTKGSVWYVNHIVLMVMMMSNNVMIYNDV